MCDEEPPSTDRLQALYAAPGYNSARQEFNARYFGGEPTTKAFDLALLTFFEKQKEPV